MKKVISFSLWGNNPMYWAGAIKNIQLAGSLYPGWICRFYVDRYAAPELIKTIEEADCEMVLMEPSDKYAGSFWRYYAAEDTDIAIFRDADSRLTEREVKAVEQWLDTDQLVHIMRDHPLHKSLIMGGMWGCRNIDGLKDLIEQYEFKSRKGTDELFLSTIVYPQIKQDAIIHDSFNLFGDSIDFPTPRPKDAFVGRIYDQYDVPK